MIVELAAVVAVGFAVEPAVAVDPFATAEATAERFVAGSSRGCSALFATQP